MNTLDTIRTELAAVLNAVSGLQAYAKVPGQINAPAATVAPDSIEYNADFEGGATYTLPVQFLVSLGDWSTAQGIMDGFVAHDGTAVEAINGADIEARVLRMEDYGLTEFAATNYLGARLIVEVLV